MRHVIAGLVLVVVMGAVASAAETKGQISDSMLAKMGMAGMQVASDAQGDAIRGKGYCGGCGAKITFTQYASVNGPGGIGSSGVSYSGTVVPSYSANVALSATVTRCGIAGVAAGSVIKF